jgi:hypothetical protein
VAKGLSRFSILSPPFERLTRRYTGYSPYEQTNSVTYPGSINMLILNVVMKSEIFQPVCSRYKCLSRYIISEAIFTGPTSLHARQFSSTRYSSRRRFVNMNLHQAPINGKIRLGDRFRGRSAVPVFDFLREATAFPVLCGAGFPAPLLL